MKITAKGTWVKPASLISATEALQQRWHALLRLARCPRKASRGSKGWKCTQNPCHPTHEYKSMLIIFGDHHILLQNPTIGIKVGRQ